MTPALADTMPADGGSQSVDDKSTHDQLQTLHEEVFGPPGEDGLKARLSHLSTVVEALDRNVQRLTEAMQPRAAPLPHAMLRAPEPSIFERAFYVAITLLCFVATVVLVYWGVHHA